MPKKVACPQGQQVAVQPSRTGTSFVARFDGAVCEACPLRERCPTQPRPAGAVRALRFTWQDLRRAAVEATIRSLKTLFAGSKAPVRGQFRVMSMVLRVAAVVNIRRLHRAFGVGNGAKRA